MLAGRQREIHAEGDRNLEAARKHGRFVASKLPDSQIWLLRSSTAYPRARSSHSHLIFQLGLSQGIERRARSSARGPSQTDERFPRKHRENAHTHLFRRRHLALLTVVRKPKDGTEMELRAGPCSRHGAARSD